MASYETFTHLTVHNLTVLDGVTLPDGTIPEPAEVEAIEPPMAPAPLPEKLTMVALAEYLTGTVDALVAAGVLKPFAGPQDGVEAAE
ncbi:hypothetical protein SEA_LISARA_26 [Arthrobacter phage LiSara]|uniref:Uncharacterized protein n=2 Tax=Laroyevirus TaxID=1982086 RepID=A0A0U4JZC5_9CAUD|nr:hypothetical protein FDH64_gp27 [Arthrobacter phage Laroye]YP_010082539.1 hypothetical protein KMD21_gp26 [Arthrobacter phage LiSara]ALY09554.1 hypothetical protein LAROYE_27 [Arthrobacter phage Laroye]ASR83610.1 hypothetical protein SEA_LISARA_26 [Arthrobacter phage LiSara]